MKYPANSIDPIIRLESRRIARPNEPPSSDSLVNVLQSMRPFSSSEEMIAVHETMFGDAGRFCAETVLRYAPSLFAEPLDPLRIRVVLAPVEIGPYNKHAGYTIHGGNEVYHFILGNRHICDYARDGSFRLPDLGRAQDFIIHELTHHRQDSLLARYRWPQNRGVHRDKGWYTAIAEAAPRYLGVAFPASVWPKLKSQRQNGSVIKLADPDRLTEPEVTHWPHSFRALIAVRDIRLQPTTSSTSDLPYRKFEKLIGAKKLTAQSTRTAIEPLER
jgi:hypothetical protein